MDQKKMKLMKDVSIFMGLFLSMSLSLIGNITSGHFTIPFLIISFSISFIISLIIGFSVPMKIIADKAVAKKGLKPGSLTARLLETLISDLIYTPIITLVIITISYHFATSNIPEMSEAVPPNYFIMAGSALVSSFLIGYVLIFIFQPICIRLAFMKNGLNYRDMQKHGGPDMGSDKSAANDRRPNVGDDTGENVNGNREQ